MQQMLFSILIANYNNGHFFKDCYESIIGQTYEKWEVVIVDDGSTDDSVEKIKKIIGQDERFKLFQNLQNRGCGFTKNKCASLAKGELAGFLDPDDVLKKDALSKMVEIHLRNPEAAIVTSRYEEIDQSLNFIAEGTHGEAIPAGESYLSYGKGALTHFASFKMEKYRQTKGIDPTMKRAVDQDLYYKLEEKGKHIFLNDVLYSYRIHQNNISINENLFKARYWHLYAMERAYYRRKHSSLKIENILKRKIREDWSHFYFSRYEEARSKGKIKKSFPLLIKSIMYNPLSNTGNKLKHLLVLLLVLIQK